MAYEQPWGRLGIFPADVDMSAVGVNTVPVYQFTPVWLGAAANVQGTGLGGAALQFIGTQTAPPLGILQNAPKLAEAGLVTVSGVTKAICSGAMNIGDPVGWATNGLSVIKATTGNYAIGTALETASVGDITTILLWPRGKQ